MKKTVCIIDYGLGNLASVEGAFRRQSEDVRICKKPEELLNATHVVLPGVGSFSEGMRNLREGGWELALNKLSSEKKIPVLGICLGMQLLASYGEEGGATQGLGLILGQVVRLKSGVASCPVPHVGWNSVRFMKTSNLVNKISDETDFYFVHSYAFRPDDHKKCVGVTSYSEEFCSIVEQDNIFGVQFHPEKSSKAGALLIGNFLTI